MSSTKLVEAIKELDRYPHAWEIFKASVALAKEDYDGFYNWETWQVYSFIVSVPKLENGLQEIISAQTFSEAQLWLEEWFLSRSPARSGIYKLLLDTTLQRVRWDEVVKRLMESA